MINSDLIQKYLKSKNLQGINQIDYTLQDDGNGVYISFWNEQKLGIKPDEVLLDNLENDLGYIIWQLNQLKQTKINNLNTLSAKLKLILRMLFCYYCTIEAKYRVYQSASFKTK